MRFKAVYKSQLCRSSYGDACVHFAVGPSDVHVRWRRKISFPTARRRASIILEERWNDESVNILQLSTLILERCQLFLF